MYFTGAKTDFAEEKNPFAYRSLNDFFTRKLAENARPIDQSDVHISSPVDGRCAIYEQINSETILQAKGLHYQIGRLLGSDEWAQCFDHGTTATLYLAPDDYHRIHMPIAGTLESMRFCPGDKHSVSLSLLDKIPNVFAGNERVVALFDTAIGKMAVVMVGALNVSSISTAWHGEVVNADNNTYHYHDRKIHFAKGEEIGRFNLGSTVILFFEQGSIEWNSAVLESKQKIFMGSHLATIL